MIVPNIPTYFIVIEKDEGDMKSVESQLFEVFLNTADFDLIWFGLVLYIYISMYICEEFSLDSI